MSVRSQRNMRDKLGIDSRGTPAFMRPLSRSRVPITRQFYEARRFRSFAGINATAQHEHAFVRNSVATILDGQNLLRTVPAHRDRYRTWNGIERTMAHIEAAATNFLLNSTAPATQTTGSLGTGTYVLWVVGTGTATITAGTGAASGLGAAVAATPIVFTVTVAGTFTVTVTGSLTRFQLENTSYPTSFIPTAGATVQRVAETLVWTPTASPGGSGLLGTTGTIIGQFIAPSLAGATFPIQSVLAIDNGTANNRYYLFMPVGTAPLTLRSQTVAGGVTNTTLNHTGAVAANTRYRFALAWDAGNTWLALTGQPTVQTGAGVTPSGLTTIRYGQATAGAGAHLNGWVGLIARFSTRLSTAAMLDAVNRA